MTSDLKKKKNAPDRTYHLTGACQKFGLRNKFPYQAEQKNVSYLLKRVHFLISSFMFKNSLSYVSEKTRQVMQTYSHSHKWECSDPSVLLAHRDYLPLPWHLHKQNNTSNLNMQMIIKFKSFLKINYLGSVHLVLLGGLNLFWITWPNHNVNFLTLEQQPAHTCSVITCVIFIQYLFPVIVVIQFSLY